MKLFSYLFIFISALLSLKLSAQDKQVLKDIVYTTSQDSYARDQCKLDVYIPSDTTDFVTLVWFHGGGLTGGDKTIPESLKNNKFAIVSASYRLAPKVAVKDIIHDAAEAVSWTMQHIEKYGGNRNKIIIGGYSAGAYLALMLGLQKDYLDEKGIDADKLIGVLSCSGQTITHFTERNARQMKETQPVVDELAPLFWVRKDAAPILLITGDRELEMLGRYEENAYLARMLKLTGHQQVKLLELEGYDHGMLYPALPLLIKEIKRLAD